MSYGRIDWQKVSHNEGYNEGYNKGFKDGFKEAYSRYVIPGSIWIEKVDAKNNIHYHCSTCDHEVAEKIDICPGCLARMQMNKEEKDIKNDLISRQDLINYLKLYNYDDTDAIKVKYIRQFLDRN